MEQKKDPIRIKKYSNRRLYDITHSRHLTLEELVELIKAGHEVQVIDSNSREDITQSVLMQMLLWKIRRHTCFQPLFFIN